MQTADWTEFDKELAVLCEAYDRKKTPDVVDAYWKGLGKMGLRDFRAVARYAIEKAGAEGYDRMPKPGRFWAMLDETRRANKIRELAGPPASVLYSAIWAHAQRCLCTYLMRKGAASDEALRVMVTEKNTTVSQFEEIQKGEEVTGGEIRDRLFKLWDKSWSKAA